MTFWKKVRSTAWNDAAKVVKFDSRVGFWGFVALQVVICLVIWFGSGSAGLFASAWTRIATAVAPFLMFPICWLIFLPSAASKVFSASEAAVTAAQQVAADANAQVEALKAAPARDPDGIYQLNRKRGQVINSRKALDQHLVFFEQMTVDGEFNDQAVFKWQDLTLRLKNFSAESWVRLPGQFSRGFNQAVCEVEDRQP